MNDTGKLVVITGPSGVGKTTIVHEVLKRCDVVFSVSVTTRGRRKGEVDGRDYRFVNRAEFEKMIADGGLLEWAEVFGELYGTPAEPIERAMAAGNTVMLDIDIQGGLQVHEKVSNATYILICPPDETVLASRLAARASEDEQVMKRRLARAAKEVQTARESGIYDHCIVNDDLETAIRQVCEIVDEESAEK